MSALVGGVSPAALDYLLGDAAEDVDLNVTRDVHWRRPGHRMLRRVAGVGIARRFDGQQRSDTYTYPTQALLAGAAGSGMPVAFNVEHDSSGTSFAVGTWPDTTAPDDASDQDLISTQAMLGSAYRWVDWAAADARVSRLELGAVVLGVPAPQPPDPLDGAVAWDRILRAVRTGHWQATVLAEPLDQSEVQRLRRLAIEELRVTLMSDTGATFGVTGSAPLAKQYSALLEALLKMLNEGLGAGLWRVATYLGGGQGALWQLASAWRGVFSGTESVLQPLRIAVRQEIPALAEAWALPYARPNPGPSVWLHPFSAQTLMATSQLASYVHLPRMETPGFGVRLVPIFSTERRSTTTGSAIEVGKILDGRTPTDNRYATSVDALTRHVFVAGLTGAGKSNTIFHLLGEVGSTGVPFLVIEPAKREYRALVGSRTFGDAVRVYTLGRETVSPLRLNPFELQPGVDPAEHIDLLRAVFTASFGMWAPLPQVLEQCLVQIYLDKGWDLATGENRRRTGPDGQVVAPTLGDLVAKARDVVPTLGYSLESEREIQAALITRLDALRRGGKGLLLDAERSTPMAELLSRPTVLELESLGDDDDKALVMGLLLVNLFEFRRATGPASGLAHLVVVEEAHRLVANTGGPGGEHQGDPRGKLVELFSQMLSEVRAYGQGFLIADQVPVRLAPDVIKNTNLKIAHRLVANDDREAMSGAMAMDDVQSTALAALPPGQAAVFSEGDDMPVIVQVALAKDAPGAHPPSDEAIRNHMRPYLPDAGGIDNTTREARELAEAMLAEHAVRRVLLRAITTACADPCAIDGVWADVAALAHARRPAHIPIGRLISELAIAGSRWVARRRGSQAGWSYENTALFESACRDLLLERAGGASEWLGLTDARESFASTTAQLTARADDPYPRCTEICGATGCRYRQSVRDVAVDTARQERWTSAVERGSVTMWDEAMLAADEVVEYGSATTWPPAVRRHACVAHQRASLCFAQQMLTSSGIRVTAVRAHLDDLLPLADLDETQVPRSETLTTT